MESSSSSNPSHFPSLRPGSWIGGALLVAIGTLLLVGQLTSPRLAAQLLLSALGLVFLFASIGTRSLAFLIPGGILSGLGLGTLLIGGPLAYLDWHGAGTVFMLCFAFGWFLITILSQLALGRVHWWPLIPGGIIGAVSLVHLAGDSLWQSLSVFSFVWPLSIIALGLYLLFGRRGVAQG